MMTTWDALKPHKIPTRNSKIWKWKKARSKKSTDLAPLPKWTRSFDGISSQALEKYLAGYRGADALFTPEQDNFLATLGCTPQDLYDFVEDWCEYGEPSCRTALRITEVRAEYFLLEQQGRRSSEVLTPAAMPSKEAELGGFVWLPRIIAKAQAKLRGEMPADLMFGCRRDRAFLQNVGIDPADFLRLVWRAGNRVEQVLDYVMVCAQFQLNHYQTQNCDAFWDSSWLIDRIDVDKTPSSV